MSDSVIEQVWSSGIHQVRDAIYRLDPTGDRWSDVIRRTYDMIYNGHDTGRYRWDQLHKTEKTHFGTLFEINAQREFGFAEGVVTDFEIAGVEVDAKWSQNMGAWMLPPEVVGKVALVATGSDQQSKWSLGLVYVSEEFLKVGTNRDQKKQLSLAGRDQVEWLWKDAPLRPNILLQLPQKTVDDILLLNSGTARVTQLFRAAEKRLVHRNAVATVARQLDPTKRIRGNGGARDVLRPEGILVLSGAYHRNIAVSLGIDIPRRDEFISVRVVEADSHGVLIGGSRWRVAEVGDLVQAAPILPRGKR